MQIRKAKPKDLVGIYEVMKNTGYSQFFGNKSFARVHDELLTFLFAEKTTTLVADDENKVIGYSIFGPYTKYYAKKHLPEQVEINRKMVDLCLFAYCLGFGVHSESRKKGLGTDLLLVANTVAKRQGYKGMVTDVGSDNVSSLRVQEKAEFILVATIPDKKRKTGLNTVWVKVF